MVVTIALAALGAVAGGILMSICLALWLVVRYGAPHPGNLGAAAAVVLMWAVPVGAPAGAVLLPLLGFTLLRRVPLGRALGYSLGGTLAGLLTAAALIPGGPIWPVPALVPTLALVGLLGGAVAARVSAGRADVRRGVPSADATAA